VVVVDSLRLFEMIVVVARTVQVDTEIEVIVEINTTF
jgi:hypothetical protein